VITRIVVRGLLVLLLLLLLCKRNLDPVVVGVCCWSVLNLCWCFESCCITYYLLPKSQIVQLGADVCVLGCRSVCEKHVIQQSFSFAFALLGCFVLFCWCAEISSGFFAVLP
jgi:hypothetical protein